MQRWNINLVKEFVKENSNCELLSTKYKNTKSLLLFKCHCGNKFETSFEKFKSRNKRQCNDCGYKNCNIEKQYTYQQVKSFIEIESKSHCKLLSNKYNNTKTNLKIKCECGNVFITTFEKFKDRNKRQCNKCGYMNIKEYFTFTYDYVKSWIETNSSCELLSDTYINCYEPLLLKCECGRTFEKPFSYFKRSKHYKCDYCSNLFSLGEMKVEEFLLSQNINYIPQYTFDELKAINNRQKLRFDFAVFDNNGNIKCLIEYDGKQHFTPVDYFGGKKSFEVLQANDKKKESFCKLNNIQLIRIPYYQLENIEEILYKNLIQNKSNNMTIPSQALTI